MTIELIQIGNHRLHVETYGDPSSPAVIYIHGGPGQGCYHFVHAQAELLAGDLYLVAVDQRGAMRSDPLTPGSDISTEDIAKDLEAVRMHLGLTTWYLIGHSAGAATAVDYAVAHPESVSGLVLDCPALDADLIDRWRLPLAADLFVQMGRPDLAARARELSSQDDQLTPATYDLLNQLGDKRNELFFVSAAAAADFDQVAERSGHPEDVWNRGESHAPILADLYHSRLHLLGTLSCPLFLVRGVDDPVSPPTVVSAIRAAPSFAGAVEVAGARHFPSFEQPEAYAHAVIAFTHAHLRQV